MQWPWSLTHVKSDSNSSNTSVRLMPRSLAYLRRRMLWPLWKFWNKKLNRNFRGLNRHVSMCSQQEEHSTPSASQYAWGHLSFSKLRLRLLHKFFITTPCPEKKVLSLSVKEFWKSVSIFGKVSGKTVVAPFSGHGIYWSVYAALLSDLGTMTGSCLGGLNDCTHF